MLKSLISFSPLDPFFLFLKKQLLICILILKERKPQDQNETEVFSIAYEKELAPVNGGFHVFRWIFASISWIYRPRSL